MTLPKVTKDCITATVEKATQQDPDVFAAEAMLGLMEDQPVLMSGVMALLQPYMEPIPDVEDVPLGFAQEMMLRNCFCVLGVALKALNAQVFAEEMNDEVQHEEL